MAKGDDAKETLISSLAEQITPKQARKASDTPDKIDSSSKKV